jgi:hypothetical protein
MRPLKLDRSDQRSELSKLSDKYNSYTDNLLAAPDYVPYAEVLAINTYEQAESHYIDINQLQALRTELNHSRPPEYQPRNDEELEHLEIHAQRFKDTVFENRIKKAIHELHIHRASTPKSATYHTALVEVRHVPHFAEIRYGVHFKDTDEYGLYGLCFDKTHDKTSESFFRSDASFRTEILLKSLRIAFNST